MPENDQRPRTRRSGPATAFPPRPFSDAFSLPFTGLSAAFFPMHCHCLSPPFRRLFFSDAFHRLSLAFPPPLVSDAFSLPFTGLSAAPFFSDAFSLPSTGLSAAPFFPMHLHCLSLAFPPPPLFFPMHCHCLSPAFRCRLSDGIRHLSDPFDTCPILFAGGMLCTLLQAYVSAINSGAVPTVMNAWEAVKSMQVST